MELYKKHRPTEFCEILGQPAAAKSLAAMSDGGKIPHSILFTGPSGTGKTTAARILRAKLKCHDHDFIEMDGASSRGIDDARRIRQDVHLAPMIGKSRVWLIDEAHKLTNDAQNALLKTLEDTPRHSYIFLASSEPNKLLEAIRTRCMVVAMKAIDAAAMKLLISTTLKKEKARLPAGVVDKIIEASNGSARKAMVKLEACLLLDDEREQMELAGDEKDTAKGIEVALHLVGYKGKTDWKKVAGLLREIKDDPETVRRIILTVCANECLKAGNLSTRAAKVMNCMRDPLFDAGTARALLTLYCWEAINL